MLYLPRVSKNQALVWAIVLSSFGFLLLFWNGGSGFVFLLTSGIFWAIWAYKHNRDTKLAEVGVAATLPPTAQAQLDPAGTALTIDAAPSMHSKGVDRLFVPPALD